MKEATGELSTTVITIVAIAAVLTIFVTILLPGLKNSINAKMHCADAYGCGACSQGKQACKYDTYKDDGSINKQGLSVNCRCDK